MKKILIVDDEKMINEALKSYFEANGFLATTADDGKEALKLFESQKFDIIILDLMLPKMSGEAVCKEIRKTSAVPIIMLTAKTADDSVINGLNMGSDDYVTKPFSVKELYARVQAVLRRTEGENTGETVSGPLTFNADAGTVKVNGREVQLTQIEAKILACLIQRPTKTFTREELLTLAFDQSFNGSDRVIDNHIKNLRKKLSKNCNTDLIKTIYGVGYRWGISNEK